MALPLFFPIPTIISARITLRGSEQTLSLRELCKAAGCECRATGEWTNRPVVIDTSRTDYIEIGQADWMPVRIGVVSTAKPIEQARYALGAMAYAVFDVVARQSIAGLAWSRVASARGRPPLSKALTGAQRQRRFRTKNAN